MKKVVVAVLLLGVAAVVWVAWGRFAVEGGRAPWAVINRRPDVLEAALAAGVSDGEKQRALDRAVGRNEERAAATLLRAGASPEPNGLCHLGGAVRFGRPGIARLLLEAGAQPR